MALCLGGGRISPVATGERRDGSLSPGRGQLPRWSTGERSGLDAPTLPEDPSFLGEGRIGAGVVLRLARPLDRWLWIHRLRICG